MISCPVAGRKIFFHALLQTRIYFSKKQTACVLMNVVFFLHSGQSSYAKGSYGYDEDKALQYTLIKLRKT